MPGPHRGATTRGTREEFRRWLFPVNEERRLADAQLAEEWNREFPLGRRMTAKRIAEERRLYNTGYPHHGYATVWSWAYDGDRNRVPGQPPERSGIQWLPRDHPIYREGWTVTIGF
jgi:hypothetical protein